MATSAYHKLHTKPILTNSNPPNPSLKPSSTRHVSRKVVLLSLAACIAILIVTLTSLSSQPTQQSQSIVTTPSDEIPTLKNQTPEECGASPSEAQSLGCVFDAVIMGWVPWRCYDANLAKDLMAERDWAFYRTADGWNSSLSNKTTSSSDQHVPVDEVLSGTWNALYVNDKVFFLFQCTYAMKKMWRAAVLGRSGSNVLDGYVADPHHNSHCEMLITKGPEVEKNLYMKYASCPWVLRDSGRFGWYRVLDGKRLYRADA